MNTKQTKFNHRLRWMCGAVLLVVAANAWGGLVAPLYIGNLEPVLDQYGRTMPGSHLAEEANSRCLVEIHTSTIDTILPPLTNGASHPFNPLLSAEGVGGVGLNTSSPNSGLFCLALPHRPVAGTQVFARVYNAPTIEEASFYADSLMVDIPARANSLVLSFSDARPLDPRDDDEDGLNNSWEKALGTDSVHTNDFDGDGMSDLIEMLAGTAPDDASSLLSFRFIRRENPAVPAEVGQEGDAPWVKPVRIRWQSVPGKKYQLEYTPMLIQLSGEDPIFLPVGEVVTAAEGEFEIEMLADVPEDKAAGSFRVRLVQ